ncbi:MAG: leucyl aminopeptidase [Pseudorhodoplanes sp.]|nr:Cytosol aminopeptidase [Pseudorhodoplanes sp.]MBW7950787.1 leucyl aminopeptidase [Pseudorhodoplanes sp.]MCL4711194.1 leucyl aminopeptidase [Pseudorhodoplanes sp.]MCQ3941864.1 leucyl aminopeptidase [Alphaproteobacteria bacterium]
MARALTSDFAPIGLPAKGVLIVFCNPDLKFGPATVRLLRPTLDLIRRAAAADRFAGKSGSALDIVAPAGLKVSRLIVLGVGKPEDAKTEAKTDTKTNAKPRDFVRLGGVAMGRVPGRESEVAIVAETGSGPMTPDEAADLALGAMLRAYAFERYKTKTKEGEERAKSVALTVGTARPADARKAWRTRQPVADGVVIARDLVNEPPNVLSPVEFARRASALRKAGVGIEILDERAMKRLGMHALLGVGQGSERESRIVIMRWNGGRRSQPPIAFIGKGVCFDAGGISIKPAAGMEDMKGDMAGAACVVGLMHALAGRKAKVNAVGAIGLVENMPDGNAQRPGDIVTSMSGQTVEIINTDAEGRLVLADVLWHVAKKFKPRAMIDLATLTGAIIVALGQEYAGLFANDDELAARLSAAGETTGEKVWRMPLAPEYDKLIDSKFADMKNTGGRYGGAITAAQFLQRFVGKTPWAHLDIAGTGMGSPSTDINRSWGSGFGVRLLDRLVADNYEA